MSWKLENKVLDFPALFMPGLCELCRVAGNKFTMDSCLESEKNILCTSLGIVHFSTKRKYIVGYLAMYTQLVLATCYSYFMLFLFHLFPIPGVKKINMQNYEMPYFTFCRWWAAVGPL